MKQAKQNRDEDEALLPTARDRRMIDEGAASTGVGALDAALDGLYWGDNVVWESEDPAAAEPFYAALADQSDAYDLAAYVSLTRPPEEVAAAYPGFEVVDARPASDLGRPAPLLQAIFERCDRAPRTVLLLDPLDAMAARWGTDTARTFFVRCCPHLLEIGAIAYWMVGLDAALAPLRREISEVTQCVLALAEGRLRIAKAEARGPGVEGSVFRCRVADGRPEIEAAPAAARLGPRCAPCAPSATSASPTSRGCSASRPARCRRPSAAGAGCRSRRCSTRRPSSTSRSTSCCAATSIPATASPAATTPAGARTGDRWR
jgi:hypothetical protein